MNINNEKQPGIHNKNGLVVGLARNCSNTIKQDIQRIYKSVNVFNDLYWLIIESDSDDDTVEKLHALEATVHNFRFKSFKKLRDKLTKRTQRIAYCRNEYLNQIKNKKQYTIKIVIMFLCKGAKCINLICYSLQRLNF